MRYLIRSILISSHKTILILTLNCASFIKRLSLTLVAHLILVQISDLHQSSFIPPFPKTLIASDPRHSFTFNNRHYEVNVHRCALLAGFSSSFSPEHHQSRDCPRRRNRTKRAHHPRSCYGRNREAWNWRSQCLKTQCG
jgi:hypothetical protein